uniref:Uncharacterized protein n=1 Tax=Anguilla anguilla TaxID=7936 RepID=A0A0E9U1Z3_ANGAN
MLCKNHICLTGKLSSNFIGGTSFPDLHIYFQSTCSKDCSNLLDPDVVARFRKRYPDGVISKPKNM